MASIRRSPQSARTTHYVYDRDGNVVTHTSGWTGHANLSAATRWVNKMTKAGIDTAGWTIRPASQE
jgi:hypothetical protein